MSEPEPEPSKHPINAEGFTRQTSTYDENQRPEQNVHAQRLPLGIATANGRCEQQSAADIRGCDPEDCQLHMPRSNQVAWKKIGDVDAVETGRVGAVMSCSATDENLRQK